MFLRTNPSQTGYTADGQQKSGGPFLVVFEHPTEKFSSRWPTPPTHSRLVATVRFVRMEQVGQWMMGETHINGKRLGLSGGFGNDGLPNHFIESRLVFGDTEKEISWEEDGGEFVFVPTVLTLRYWTSSGHNAVGSAAPLFKQWAASTKELWPRGIIRMDTNVKRDICWCSG